MTGPTKFSRTTQNTQMQAVVSLPVEERLHFAVPLKQSLFQDRERSAHEKSVTYLHSHCFQGYWEKNACLAAELAGQHFLRHKVYEDKIISLGVMTQAASLGNQILPWRFEVILKNNLPINSFC